MSCSAVLKSLLLSCLLGATTRGADAVSIAAAANLVYVLGPLDTAFSRANPDVALTTANGSSGSLVAQIRNGAPFDVFLSADMDYPRQLIRTGAADGATLTPFCIGRLVLWTTKTDLSLTTVPALVRDPAVHKLALANPGAAPYGRAAREVLTKLGLATEAQPKLVVGENIAQTTQYVETGNADAGFVALSLLLSPPLQGKGRWLEIPADFYTPLTQGAILTTRGAANPGAKAYLKFLLSPPAQSILSRFGYAQPPSRSP